jgi:hypothetical protein
MWSKTEIKGESHCVSQMHSIKLSGRTCSSHAQDLDSIHSNKLFLKYFCTEAGDLSYNSRYQSWKLHLISSRMIIIIVERRMYTAVLTRLSIL